MVLHAVKIALSLAAALGLAGALLLGCAPERVECGRRLCEPGEVCEVWHEHPEVSICRAADAPCQTPCAALCCGPRQRCEVDDHDNHTCIQRGLP